MKLQENKYFYKLIITSLFLLCILFLPGKSYANWNDLHESEHEIYGYEKELKYPINGFFIEKEKWENHYSFMFLWLYKYKNYPKYESIRVIPIYYNLKSKIDNRELTVLFPFYFHKTEFDHDYTITPLGFKNKIGDDTHRSYLWLWYSGENLKNNNSYKSLIPIFYSENQNYENYKKYVYLHKIYTPLFGYSKKVNRNYIKKEENKEIFNLSLLHYYSSYEKYNSGRIISKSTKIFFPIVPVIFYYNKNSDGTAHKNLLMAFDWATNSKGEFSRFWSPVYLWKKDSYTISPLFLYMNVRNENSGLKIQLPLFYSYYNKEENSYSFGFPVLPIIYHSYYKRNYNRKTLLSVISWTNKNDKLATISTPIFLYKKNNYKHILPIYFSWNDGENHLYLNPIFLKSRNGNNKNFGLPVFPFIYYQAWNDYAFTNLVLSLFYYKSDSRYNETTIINPLLQYKSSTYENYYGMIPVFFYHNNIKKQVVTTLSPLHYYKSTYDGTKKSFYSLLYFSNKNEHEEASGFPIIPIGYYHYENKNYSKNIYLTLFYHKKDKQSDENTFISPVFQYKTGRFWGALPLYFYYKNDEGTVKTFSPIHYSSRSKDNNQKFQVNPVYFYSKDYHEEYFGFPLAPILYYSHETELKKNRRILGLISWKTNYISKVTEINLPPIYFYKTGKYHGFVPVYFWHKSDDGSERSYSLIHYKKNSKDSDTLWLLPWFSHNWNKTSKETPDHFRMLAPLYYSWHKNDKNFNMILPIYASYESEKDNFYVNILGYSSSNVIAPYAPGILPGANDKGYYLDVEWSIFYNLFSVTKRIPLKKHDIFINEAVENKDSYKLDENEIAKISSSPKLQKKRYVSKENSLNYWGFSSFFGLLAYEKADTKRHFRLFPMAWATWDKNSDDEVFMIPGAYFSYKQADVSYQVLFPFFIPLYGSSHNGKSYAKIYVLNLFWNEYDAEKQQHEYSVLWPIFNWYSSPTGKGGRVFPVAWYKECQDKNKYNSRLISPIWVKRNEINLKDPFIKKGYNISPLFINSYNYKNRSNYYDTWWAPVLPLFYHKENQDGETNRLLYALYSGHSDYNKNAYSINLLYGLFHNENRYGTKEETKNKLEEQTQWLTPIYYYNINYNDNGYITTKIATPLSFTKDSISLSQKNSRKGYMFNPLFYHGYDSKKNYYSETKWWPIVPVIYSYNSTNEKEFRFLISLYKTNENYQNHTKSTNVAYGLFTHKEEFYSNDFSDSNLKSYKSWLLPLYYASEERNYTGVTSHKAFFPAFIPVYYGYKNNKSYFDTYFAILYQQSFDEDKQMHEYSFMWPFINVYKSAAEQGWRFFPIHWHKEHENSYTINKTNFTLPLLAYSSETINKNNGKVEKFSVWPFSFYSEKYKDKDNMERTFGIPVIPVVYNKTSISNGNKSSYYNIVALLAWETTNEKYNLFRFAPLFFYKNETSFDFDSGYASLPLILFYHGWDKNYNSYLVGPIWYSLNSVTKESSFHIFPFLYNKTTGSYSKKFWFGYYNYLSRDYERTNFIGLYDHKNYLNENRNEYKYLWGLFDHKNSPNYSRTHGLFGIMIDYENHKNSADYNLDIMMLFSCGNNDNKYHNYLLPLWYHSRTNDTLLQYYTPMYINYESPTRKLTLVGLGSLWYKNMNLADKKGSDGVLWGLFYKSEYDTYRNYKNKNMLLGLLWEKESESNRNFEKFSILKFVYKKVSMDNTVYHKIFGITVSKSEVN